MSMSLRHIKQDLVALKLLKLQAGINTKHWGNASVNVNEITNRIQQELNKFLHYQTLITEGSHSGGVFLSKYFPGDVEAAADLVLRQDGNIDKDKYTSEINKLVFDLPCRDTIYKFVKGTEIETYEYESRGALNSQIDLANTRIVKLILEQLAYDNLDLGLCCYWINVLEAGDYLAELENDRLENLEDGIVESREVVEGFETINKQLNYYEGVVLSFDASELISGMEGSNIIDSIKKAGTIAYETIMATLKSIKEYIQGDSEEQIKATIASCREVMDGVKSIDPNTPIKEGPITKATTYFKSMLGSPKVVQTLESDDDCKDIQSELEQIKTISEGASNCKTAGELSKFFDSLGKATVETINRVTDTLNRKLTEAEKNANQLRNPKLPKESDPAEVAQGVKQENKEVSDEAKAITKTCQTLTSIRNGLASVLTSIKTNAGKIKETKVESEFKG